MSPTNCIPLTLSLVTESLAINPSTKQAVQVGIQRRLARLQQLVSDL